MRADKAKSQIEAKGLHLQKVGESGKTGGKQKDLGKKGERPAGQQIGGRASGLSPCLFHDPSLFPQAKGDTAGLLPQASTKLEYLQSGISAAGELAASAQS